MKNKIGILTLLLVLLAGLIPAYAGNESDSLPSTPVELEHFGIDFGLADENEIWLKSGSQLYYSQNAGQQWSDISPETHLSQPYLIVSFPDSKRGYALYLTQTETRLNLELYKTSSKGVSWIKVAGNLEEELNKQFSRPFAKIEMQWLDENRAFVLVKEATSSNFSMGTLFVSDDGGRSWRPLEVPVAEAFIFLNRELGFMLNPADATTLYRSLDGGESWELFSLELTDQIDHLLQIGLPIQLKGKQTYLPAKTVGEDLGETDVLLRIEPSPTTKSTAAQGMPELLPLRVIFGEKQVPPAELSQISKIQTQDAHKLWVGLMSGECTTFTTDGGEGATTCERSWQLGRSVNGGLDWELVGLPNGRNIARDSFISSKGGLEEKEPAMVFYSGEWVQNFYGHAFDKCEIPTLNQLQTWYSKSPYKAVNLYIGGISRFCSNKPLSAAYLQAMSQQGWRFIPTWVGHQAPCAKYKYPFPYDVAEAYQYGVNNANQAKARLMEYGLSSPDGSGSIIYLDLEHFTYSSACSKAARAYVNGWTTRLAQLGIRSGLYATTSNITDNRFFDLEGPEPDAIWPAEWYRTPGFREDETVWNLRYLSNDYWVYHQRILQYSGGHFETWGGVKMEIDCNVSDGPAAVPCRPIILQPHRRWFPMIGK